MTRVRWMILLMAGLGLASTESAASQRLAVPVEQPRVLYLGPSDGLPEAVVIKPTLPDDAQVCAEPIEGVVSCRTAGEFRAWVAGREP